MVKIGDAVAQSVFFDMGVKWAKLSAKDRRTCQKNVMRNIHKLPFGVPRGVSATDLSELETTVRSFYDKVKRDARSVLAYKGGHYERDLVASLAIPAVNLENFGCPKAGELFDHLIWLETW